MRGHSVKRQLRWVGALSVVVALFAAASAGTAVAERSSAPAASAKVSGTITVSAAASLTEAFTKMGTDFQKKNKGTTITFNFAASSALVTQIQGGAPADVFASADGNNMQKLVTGGQVTAEPTVSASNLLTIVVKKGNPKNVKSLKDLAALPGNRFEALAGNRKGQYSIRVNDQWRLCFEWPDGAPGPSNVEIVDYH